MTALEGHASRRATLRLERDAEHELITTDRADALPGAGREAHLRQALVASSRRATGRATTSRATSAIADARAARRSPRCGRACARRRCTRCGEADGGELVEVEVTPSNCVQCGAITAKGGRLTPPEGGSGPEYTADVGRAMPALGSRPRGRPTSLDDVERAGARRSAAGCTARRLLTLARRSREPTGARVHLKAELFQRTGLVQAARRAQQARDAHATRRRRAA